MCHLPIYLDTNATTPIDPRVADAMTPYLREHFGNPNSGHVYGRTALAAVDKARAQVAGLLGCAPNEVIFTSGGSESNNLAIKGAAWAREDRGRHLVISAVEHPATSAVCDWLAGRGWEVSVVPVDDNCLIDPADVAKALRPDTVLVSIMHANNEVGTVQPIAEIAAVAHEAGALMHTDAAQSAGKLPVRVDDLGVDLLSLASHKLYGPKGVGALYVRDGVTLENLVHGAKQESGRRAGTESVILVAGLGEAAALAAEDVEEEAPRLSAMRDRLQTALTEAAPATVVHARDVERLPNTLSIGFPGMLASDLMAKLDGIACSAGAACNDGGATASAVLMAMDAPFEAAVGTLRLSLGRFTTEDELDRATKMITAVVSDLR